MGREGGIEAQGQCRGLVMVLGAGGEVKAQGIGSWQRMWGNRDVAWQPTVSVWRWERNSKVEGAVMSAGRVSGNGFHFPWLRTG